MTDNPLTLMDTGDGSHSLYNADLDESYHSHHGALRESQYVYIDQGLSLLPDARPIRVLEVGLGTGLNVMLTLLAQRARPTITIDMTSLEPYPVPLELIDQLNYSDLLQADGADRDLYRNIHSGPWDEPRCLTPGMTFTKRQTRLEDWTPPTTHYDIVYYDAFAPSKQSDIWALANLQKCASVTRPGGLLVTYCAQGRFKRDLRAAGYQLGARLPGPPGGKNEMVRGIIPAGVAFSNGAQNS